MRELRPGLWHWTADHPAWTPKDDWPQAVSCYAVESGDGLVLVDPLAPPEELAGRAIAVVVTSCPWHRRDSERIGAPVYEAGSDYGPGDTLPGGIVAHAALEPNDLVLWLPAHRALVLGDTLIDRGNGLEIPVTWTPVDVSRDERAATLSALLELPVELVLPTHGPPTDRAALERALAEGG
jgi:glyoxylase-like metal-dependent hydrolase (beta-lactamase superfamily II)